MNKRYIYNPLQATFMMTEGCKPIKVGRHSKTNNLFWVFNKEECQEAFVKWSLRKR